jgi:flagellar hook-associated protein 1 FlgK
LDAPLATQEGDSISLLYQRLSGNLTQASSVARSVAEGFRTFQLALKGEQLSISGVSLDEEAVRMITYQRTFQMSARFAAAVSEMLDALVHL